MFFLGGGGNNHFGVDFIKATFLLHRFIRVVTKSMLSLCLSKNEVIRHECEWNYRSKNSYTLHDMGMSDQLHSPAILTPREMVPVTHWSEDGWKLESVRTNLLLLPPIQARFLNCLFRNLLGITTELLRLLMLLLMYHFIVIKVLLFKYTFSVRVGHSRNSHLRQFSCLNEGSRISVSVWLGYET